MPIIFFQSILFSLLDELILVDLLRMRQTFPKDPYPNTRIISKQSFNTSSLSISRSSPFIGITIMRKLNLTFPDEIVQELSFLCLNSPKVCKKESAMGWTSNGRIIIVRDGLFQYFNLHQGYRKQDLSTLSRKHFKGAVRLNFIHQVNFLPKNKIKKNFVEIVFPERRMIVRGKEGVEIPGQNDEQYIKNSKEEALVKWLFEFDFDVKDYIEEMREKERQKQRKQAKIIPLSPKEMKELAISDFTPRKITPEDRDLQNNIQQYVLTVQKTKHYLKSKAQLAQQQKARQKKMQQKQKAQLTNMKQQSIQQTYSLSTFWRDYFKDYEAVIKFDLTNKSQRFDKVQKQLQLLRQIQFFNNSARRVTQNFVDQYVAGVQQIKKQFEGFKYYQGLWIKLGGKELNQQYMVNYYINDILVSLKDIKGYKFRLPLMSLIEYKGIKMLVMCDMPFSQIQKTQVYNLLSEEGDLQFMAKMKEALDIIQDVLNVKSEPLELSMKRKVLAPLGSSLKIFEYAAKKDKTQDQAILPNFYYLINPGLIFPVDFNFQKEQLNIMARLRPELVAFFRDYYKQQDPKLLTQAFMNSSMPEETKRIQDTKVIQASHLIESYWIPLLIERLDNVQLLFIDSYSIKSIMQQMGINIRYLFRIYQSTNLPYIRELILVDVLARTIKKQFRLALQQLTQQVRQKHQLELYRKGIRDTAYINQKRYEIHKAYKEFAIDYLNLIFGEGQESQEFWKIILSKCRKYFKIGTVFPPPVRPGSLLNSVLWHCKLSLNFQDNIPLFMSDKVFGEGNNLQFQSALKTFDYPSFQIQKIFRSAPSIDDKFSMQLLKQSTSKLLKLQILYGKTIGSNWQTQIAISKMNNMNQMLAKPASKNKFLPLLVPYYLINKSKYNYQQGIKILNFSLPQSHPLLVTYYLQYSQFFHEDKQLLQKTAILLAVKSFGQFHRKTTQLYSKFYHEGRIEYALKARRVKSIEACYQINTQYFEESRFQSCLTYCLELIQQINEGNLSQQIGMSNYNIYLKMLIQGLQSALKVLELQKGVIISKEISETVSSYKFKNNDFTEMMFRKILLIHLLKANKKYFLYKMVLLVVHIRSNVQSIELDELKLSAPCKGEEKIKIVQGLATQYYQHGNHSDWVAYILASIIKSFQYFNFLQDLFNNYQHHLKRYNNEDFKICLGYLDLFVRLYGQKMFKETLYDVNFG